jgi:multiple sugar transport system substrate-binding protein
VINPSTEFPQQGWELLAFMNSAEAVEAALAGDVRITQREDVNAEVLSADPMLQFVAEEILPITAYRPGLAIYPRIHRPASARATSCRQRDQVSGPSGPTTGADTSTTSG